ncbi:MAG: O-antigen ligase family protein [Cyanobacteria bacterium SID2]|nr:O-antigen ligase family protein [Cyanobacteria bacterium SID2]MBP0004575.1 O-antigen ligase family protein [Cyanobacteria bacterium SBC]
MNWKETGIRGGVLAFPVSPFLGGLAIVGVTVWVWWREWRELLKRPLVWSLGVFAGLLVLSSFAAIDRSSAFLGLFNFLPFLVVFIAVSSIVRHPFQLRQLSEAVVLSSIPVVVVGLGQMFLGWNGPIDWGILLFWPLEKGGAPPDRMSSVFEYANVLANYASIIWALGLGLSIEAFQTQRLKRFLLWSGICLGNSIVLLLTNSRNAWGVAFACCVAYAVYLGWRWLVAAIASVATIVLAAAFAPEPFRSPLRRIVPAYFWARLSDELHPDRPIEMMRVTQWTFAWNLGIDRPFTGWGLRNFTALYESQMGLWLGHPHNLLLMLVAETGFLTTLVLCGIVAWVFFRGVQVLRPLGSIDRLMLFTVMVAFGSIVLFHLFDVTLFDSRINILGWLLLAAIEGVDRQSPVTS